jgi:hypothetical protein
MNEARLPPGRTAVSLRFSRMLKGEPGREAGFFSESRGDLFPYIGGLTGRGFIKKTKDHELNHSLQTSGNGTVAGEAPSTDRLITKDEAKETLENRLCKKVHPLVSAIIPVDRFIHKLPFRRSAEALSLDEIAGVKP